MPRSALKDSRVPSLPHNVCMRARHLSPSMPAILRGMAGGIDGDRGEGTVE